MRCLNERILAALDAKDMPLCDKLMADVFKLNELQKMLNEVWRKNWKRVVRRESKERIEA